MKVMHNLQQAGAVHSLQQAGAVHSLQQAGAVHNHIKYSKTFKILTVSIVLLRFI